MLSIKEVRDSYLAQFKLLCQVRNIKEIGIAPHDKLIASWIASGQQEIVDRLKLLTTYYDLAYTAQTTFSPISLATLTDFGKLLKTEPELNIVDINAITTAVEDGDTLQQGEIHSIAIYFDGTSYKAALTNLPASSGTIRLWYSKNTGFYSPSGTSAQNWGTFDGSTFTGNLKLPERYLDLLLTYMLGKIFPDKQQEYESTLQRMRSNISTTYKDEVNYNLGGYSAE